MKGHNLAIAFSAVLLAGAAVERYSLSAPADAAPYHRRVRARADVMPLRFDEWEGHDVPVPAAAVTLLKPNVLYSREFVNRQSGERASVLIVQCQDTRELVVHYPPVCYPGRGYQLASKVVRSDAIGNQPISWTDYEFVQQSVDRFTSIIVSHFVIMPNGSVQADMDAMRSSAARVADRFYGGAQMHVVTDGAMSGDRRASVVRAMVAAHLPLINEIRNGVRP